MVRATFRSRSRTTPQQGQVSVRPARGRCCRCAHCEQSCDVDAGFTATYVRPAHAALYARRSANWVHAASCIRLAKPWVCTIRLTDNSSTARRSTAFPMRRRGCWAQSLRRQVLRAETRATTVRRAARALRVLAQPTLRFGKGRFLLTEEAGGGHRLPSAERGQGLEAHVYANRLPRLRQGGRLRAFARAGDVPLARAAAAHDGRLGGAPKRAMGEQRAAPDGHDGHAWRARFQLTAHRHLGEREAVVAPLAPKAGIPRHPRHLTGLGAAQERRQRASTADGDGVHDRRLHPSQPGPLRFARTKRRVLVIEPHRLTALLPRLAPFRLQVLVPPAPLLTALRQQALLLFGRVQAVRACLTHAL